MENETLIMSGAASDVPGGGDGGNVIMNQSRIAKPGDIVFRLGDDTEVLRFNGDGTVSVRGEQVDSNPEIYLAFRGWLAAATR